MSRPSWVEIDLGAVAHNVRQLAAHASDAKLCAVVKADGYGHGAPAVAKTALDNGAAWLAVATVEEGVQLREEGITAPVLLLSEPPRDDLDAVANADLTPTLYTVPAVDALAQVVHRRGEGGMEVHLKVDTGMHRVGAHPKALPELARRVSGRPPLRLGGIWSHFAVADTDPDFTRRQIEIFDRAVRLAKAALPAGSPPVLRHLANTPGALSHPDSHLDMVRTGLGIYGLYPHPAARPLIFTGLRTSAGLSVIGAIVGDFFFGRGQPGLGILLDRYSRRLRSEELLTAVIVACLLGVVAFWIFGVIGRRAVGHWDPSWAEEKH